MCRPASSVNVVQVRNECFFRGLQQVQPTMLVANPPYIPAPDDNIIMPQLHGGTDGANLTRVIPFEFKQTCMSTSLAAMLTLWTLRAFLNATGSRHVCRTLPTTFKPFAALQLEYLRFHYSLQRHLLSAACMSLPTRIVLSLALCAEPDVPRPGEGYAADQQLQQPCRDAQTCQQGGLHSQRLPADQYAFWHLQL